MKAREKKIVLMAGEEEFSSVIELLEGIKIEYAEDAYTKIRIMEITPRFLKRREERLIKEVSFKNILRDRFPSVPWDKIYKAMGPSIYYVESNIIDLDFVLRAPCLGSRPSYTELQERLVDRLVRAILINNSFSFLFRRPFQEHLENTVRRNFVSKEAARLGSVLQEVNSMLAEYKGRDSAADDVIRILEKTWSDAIIGTAEKAYADAIREIDFAAKAEGITASLVRYMVYGDEEKEGKELFEEMFLNMRSDTSRIPA